MLSSKIFSSHEKEVQMPKVVYHYCSMTSFLSILETSSLRLSNITKSNDPTEIINIIPTLKEVVTNVLITYNEKISNEYKFSDNVISDLIDNFFEDLSINFYAICFSEKRDLLSQWDRYADNAKGVAIGFDTRYFVLLQIETELSYIFSKIIYDKDFLSEHVEEALINEINKKWVDGNDAFNVNLIENTITNLICTVLKFSVLFKDEFFAEENEWRLVYNPLGRIRRLDYALAYHDRLIEMDQDQAEYSGFTKGKCQFIVKDNGISSYVDLNFEPIRKDLIREIIIGPKSNLEPYDKDLQYFLTLYGYRTHPVSSCDKLVLSKSDKPFR